MKQITQDITKLHKKHGKFAWFYHSEAQETLGSWQRCQALVKTGFLKSHKGTYTYEITEKGFVHVIFAELVELLPSNYVYELREDNKGKFDIYFSRYIDKPVFCELSMIRATLPTMRKALEHAIATIHHDYPLTHRYKYDTLAYNVIRKTQ